VSDADDDPLCYRFLLYHPDTGEHSVETVLCMRCQFSLAHGIDPRKLPRKKTGPGRTKSDPEVVLPPVEAFCDWCEEFGWEPAYEHEEMRLRARDLGEPEPPRVWPAREFEDATGNMSLF
jgi:hypothetical protein